MKKLIAFSAAMIFVLNGCGVQKSEPTVWPDSDKVWNSFNIMQSENGYYFSGMSSLFLQYHDKETGSEIMLCDKPECPHDGRETCAATYKNMQVSNTVMYNGALYFAGVEASDENFTVSLFKAAPDGSAIDKVCTLVSVKNTIGSVHAGLNYSNLTIHRGYVFINAELYDVSEGELKVSGINVKDYEIITFYRKYWQILQKNVLFTGIGSNLKFGNEHGIL